MKYLVLSFAAAVFVITFCLANGLTMAQKTKQPVELGAVNWLRDLDEAQAKSKSEHKLVALLFQEVPG